MIFTPRNYFKLIIALNLFCSFYPLKSQISDLSKIINVIDNKKDNKEPIGIKDFPGFLDDIPLPNGMKTVLENIQVKIPEITNTKKLFSVSGEAVLKGVTIQTGFSIEKQKKQMSFKIALPEGVDFKKSFPELKEAADILSTAIGTSYFIISDYSYKDPELEVQVDPGFNFGATIDLTGPLKKLQDWFDTIIESLNGKEKELKKKKSKIKPGFVFIDKVAVTLSGVIPQNPSESKFSVILPWRIGLNFNKAFKDPYVKKLMTADFIASVGIKGEGSVSGGLLLELKSQKDPLEFRFKTEVEAEGAIAFEAQMKGSYKPAFGLDWLGIGPLGAKLGFMIEPPWLDEIAFKGGLSLGTILSVKEGVISLDISSGNLLLSIDGANLDIDDLIKLLITMAEKINNKDIKMPKIPDIEFKDMNLKLAPVAMRVFDTYYPAGIAAGGIIKIGKFEGGIDVDVQTEKPMVYAKGFLNKFEVNIGKKNKTIFLITGVGEDEKIDTKDDKALIEINIAPYRSPLEQKLAISGIIDIPPIKFRHECNVRWEDGKFITDVETTLAEIFKGTATIRFDTKEPSDFYFKLTMEQKASEIIRKKVEKAMTEFEKKAKADLAKAQAEIDQLDEKMDELRKKREEAFKKAESGAAGEVKNYNEKLTKIEKELAELEKECPGIPNPFKEPCREKMEKNLEKAGLKIATGALEAGDKIIKGVAKAISKIDEALQIERVAQKVATTGLDIARGSVEDISEATKAVTSGVFVLESGSFETSGSDLKEKKLPKVSMKLQVVQDVTLELKDIQMDLDEPDEFFKDLAHQIITSFEKKKT